eukprot:TRINITY_DN5543_c0_g1_i5.p1 TRINITY_DN5543_c0_g1~~TRINITY_DN5543_c0_g1_i5.p1  ORF type:complete len:281 (+),score=75.68 TRINITY_DN5543_c0_g1_i5:184-1026(+)
MRGKRSFLELEDLHIPLSSISKRLRFTTGSSPLGLSLPHPSSSSDSSSSPAITHLMALFPDVDQQLLERALEACGNDLDSAIKSLNELSLGSAGIVSDTGMGTNDQQPPQGGDPASEDAAAQNNLPTHGSEWVELLVSEMMNASDMDGAKGRASRVLEAFEKSVASRASAEAAEHFHQKENMLKEHCELLKRAVKIQHIREHTILKRVDEGKQEDDERVQELQKQLVATEHEHQKKSQELQQVKQLLSQSQVECYALTMQLRQALQSNSSIPDRFHPHVF